MQKHEYVVSQDSSTSQQEYMNSTVCTELNKTKDDFCISSLYPDQYFVFLSASVAIAAASTMLLIIHYRLGQRADLILLRGFAVGVILTSAGTTASAVFRTGRLRNILYPSNPFWCALARVDSLFFIFGTSGIHFIMLLLAAERLVQFISSNSHRQLFSTSKVKLAVRLCYLLSGLIVAGYLLDAYLMRDKGLSDCEDIMFFTSFAVQASILIFAITSLFASMLLYLCAFALQCIKSTKRRNCLSQLRTEKEKSVFNATLVAFFVILCLKVLPWTNYVLSYCGIIHIDILKASHILDILFLPISCFMYLAGHPDLSEKLRSILGKFVCQGCTIRNKTGSEVYAG
ncbi:hypothetical protein TTRE_0000297401 [Trichuris trichiura]|uniref:G-protein coupled receptors family 1 profile domain-containing protein n=1 Tax=Trichuris trichiura TaxID=36087 RepID=A0A077Z4G2_TRITR|nr:hypothetical protein TTRE_0000297401 [Trichuris trichiura]